MIDTIHETYGKHQVGDITHTFYSGFNVDLGITEWCVYSYVNPNEIEIVAVCWYSEAEYAKADHSADTGSEKHHAVEDPYAEALAYYISIGGSV